MADRRRREMRVTDDDEYKDEPSRSIPGQDVQESPAEKKARIDRMIEVQVVRDIFHSPLLTLTFSS